MHYRLRKFPRTVLSSVVALLGAAALPAAAAEHAAGGLDCHAAR
jgi:hypothetical protein